MLPLGNPPVRGGLGYPQPPSPLPLTVPRGSWRNGPMRASAPTLGPLPSALSQRPTHRSAPTKELVAYHFPVGADALIRPPVQAATPAIAARSEAERAEREAAQMRPCTPLTSAPSATGRQLQTCRRPKRARRPAQIGACTDTPTPVARRATAPERANAFLFGPCTAHFSFGTTKEKWGVHLPSHQHG